MSLYVAKVGILKIKPEYIEEFGYLFNGEYEKVHDSVFDLYFHEVYSAERYEWIKVISNWKHDNEKKEWEGKYTTSYKDGIFTFGISYNIHNRSKSMFIHDFFAILRKITEEVIAWDGWSEE